MEVFFNGTVVCLAYSSGMELENGAKMMIDHETNDQSLCPLKIFAEGSKNGRNEQMREMRFFCLECVAARVSFREKMMYIYSV
jgi:hypothetical protein